MQICLNSKCQHKDLFPILPRDLFSMIFVIIFSILASASGNGGGSLLFFIFMVILQFNGNEAIPLSMLTVFGISFFNFFTSLDLKHPARDTLALDYKFANLIIPMILYGTSIGVMLTQILPFAVITISVIIILLWSTFSSFQS